MSTKSIVIALILGLATMAPSESSAGSWPQSPAERVQVFATCTGRLSALVDHERTVRGTAVEFFEKQRGAFQSLLNAVVPDALEYGLPKSQVMNWLLHAKLAQSQLLMRADFYGDAMIQEKARAAADAFLHECDQFLLG